MKVTQPMLEYRMFYRIQEVHEADNRGDMVCLQGERYEYGI